MPQQAPGPSRSDVDVLKALNHMTEVLGNQELCRMDPQLAGACGIAVGDQIRIKRDAVNYALYTVSAFHCEGAGSDVIRMGLDGRQKLGTVEALSNIDMYVGGGILRSDLSDGQAEALNEFVERLDDNGAHTGLVALAPHGGGIERFTDMQAEYVAAQLSGKGVSSWRCKGWKNNGSASKRWHITASNISRNSFPLLDTIADRSFDYAVSFHGWSLQGILIGGAGPLQVKQAVQDALIAAINDMSIDVTIADSDDDEFNGDNPNNVVNWLTANGAGGIQLEQSVVARMNYWQQIADAVASVFDSLI